MRCRGSRCQSEMVAVFKRHQEVVRGRRCRRATRAASGELVSRKRNRRISNNAHKAPPIAMTI